jgi:anti-sigma regulatory factor (Ser/Thr protein kinase)
MSDLALARRAVREFMAARPVSPRAAYAVELVIEELVANVVRHALPEAGDNAVLLLVRFRPDRLTVVVEDHGRPFDPTAHPEPTRAPSLEELPVGGLGIPFVRKAAETMTWRRDGDVNHVEVVIRNEPEADGAVS